MGRSDLFVMGLSKSALQFKKGYETHHSDRLVWDFCFEVVFDLRY